MDNRNADRRAFLALAAPSALAKLDADHAERLVMLQAAGLESMADDAWRVAADAIIGPIVADARDAAVTATAQIAARCEAAALSFARTRRPDARLWRGSYNGRPFVRVYLNDTVQLTDDEAALLETNTTEQQSSAYANLSRTGRYSYDDFAGQVEKTYRDAWEREFAAEAEKHAPGYTNLICG